MARNQVEITVVGNLTADPELRYAATGTAVCRLGVAVNPRTYDKAKGEWVDGDASFYWCTAFGQLAENAAETLTKGMRVIVTGQWGQRHWTADDGEKKSAWQLTADDVAPSLAWATAKVNKTQRASRGEVAPDDPWATASAEPPAGWEREAPF